MDISNTGSSSTLPTQRVTNKQRTEDWKKASVNYYINFRYTNGSNLRSDRNRKIINYDLANGIINQSDVQKICDPLGTGSATFSDQFMHQDKISGPLHLLLGEESEKPDNSLVYSESSSDLSRKQDGLKGKIIQLLQQQLMAEVDPSTVDPNNPPQTPEQVLKAEKYNPSDIIESKANKILKVLKKRLNTKWHLNQGFKDALIAGEEIYWTGILNGEPAMRKCNPLNMTIILDDSDVFVDEAIAIVEERLLTVPSIIDEYGDELTKSDLDKLDEYSRGTFGSFNTAGGFEPSFTIDNGKPVMNGITPNSSYMGNNVNNYALRVCRVEWLSQKMVGTLEYTDTETGEQVSKLVDETFKSLFNDFKSYYPDAEIEWFWINESWEGIRIANDIYIGIRPKANQRRRMDNPYYCQLGYTGFIYEATNSRSVSLVDRLKSYQYLYDIISYKLQLVFASDIGKVLIMDLAQIPRSEGIDVEKWFYYMKEMKVAFINSFEEGKKGSAQGKLSNFNQFNQVDMSLANSVQQYINYLQLIEQQIYTVSGVNPQRLGAIKTDEAVSNVQQATSQSALITQYLFDAHQEVKRRLYTSLIEVAKIAWKDGKVTQFVNDDLGLEILNLEEFEFENSEFCVFVSNLNKDKEIKMKLDQLSQIAMEQQKADLSTIIDTILNDSPKDIIAILRKAEQDFNQRKADQSKAQQEHEAKMQQDQLAHEQTVWAHEAEEKQKDRDLEQYKVDSTNQTKIQVQEIANYFQATEVDADNNGIPDPLEIGAQALEAQALSSKQFVEQQKLAHDKTKHDKELTHKDKELRAKQDVEKAKIEAIRVQNISQEKMQTKQIALEKDKMKSAEKNEQLKAKTAIQVARMKPKPKPPTKKK